MTHMVLRNEKHFFEVVRETPDLVESEDMLRRARLAVIDEKNNADELGDGVAVLELNLLLTYLGDEIRALNKRQERIRIKAAIIALFGQEGWGRFAAYTYEQIAKSSGKDRDTAMREALK